MNEFTQVDLIRMIEQDLGPGRKSGRWVRFHCPFPGHKNGDRNPSLAATNGDNQHGPGWRCFTCGLHGSPVKWLMEKRGLSYQDALETLGSDSGLNQTDTYFQPTETPPGQIWQGRARNLVGYSRFQLFDNLNLSTILWDGTDPDTGAKITRQLTPLEWLKDRGLELETVRYRGLGWNPCDLHDKPEKWGLSLDKPVWIPRGIVIPCIINQAIWYLKIRRPQGNPKYIHIPGSIKALYNADSLENREIVTFTEGELDAILLAQEADDLTGVVTLGAATNPLNVATWGLHLIYASQRFLAYDADPAGEKGAASLKWLHPVKLSVPCLKPFDKDLTDFQRRTGKLHDWLEGEIMKTIKPCLEQKCR
ncbi:MAG: CHC2 zinc finger domain-containing protein [Anaerolineales bacterium]